MITIITKLTVFPCVGNLIYQNKRNTFYRLLLHFSPRGHFVRPAGQPHVHTVDSTYFECMLKGYLETPRNPCHVKVILSIRTNISSSFL